VVLEQQLPDVGDVEGLEVARGEGIQCGLFPCQYCLLYLDESSVFVREVFAKFRVNSVDLAHRSTLSE